MILPGRTIEVDDPMALPLVGLLPDEDITWKVEGKSFQNYFPLPTQPLPCD